MSLCQSVACRYCCGALVKVKGLREGGWKRSVAMRGWGCQWEEEGEGL